MTAPNMKEVVERVEAKARRLEDLAKAHGRTKEAQERAQAAADLRALLAYVGECRDLSKHLLHDDHKRGCEGRCYSCACGYDDETARLAARQLEGGG